MRSVHTSRYLLVFCSKTFVDALQRAGAQATLILFEGKTHTDLFLQVSDVPDIILLTTDQTLCIALSFIFHSNVV
jgi:hypothetical protein